MKTIPKPYVLLIVISILNNACKVTEAIKCYQCGTEAILIDYDGPDRPSKSVIQEAEDVGIAIESCANLDQFSFSSWGMYSVECGPGEICTKTIIDDGEVTGTSDYYTASRGCARRNTSAGDVHPMGCGILKTNLVPPVDMSPRRYNLICFCDEDYCNRAPAERKNEIILITFLLSGRILFELFV